MSVRSIHPTIMMRISKMGVALFAPLHKLEKNEDERRASIISAITLLIVLAIIVEQVLGGNTPRSLVFIFLANYILARTRWHKTATFILVIGLCFPSYFSALNFATPDVSKVSLSFIWLVLPILLSSLFYSTKATVILCVFLIVGVILLPTFQPRITMEMLSGTLGFITTVSAFVLLVMIQRNKLEQDRQAQTLQNENLLQEEMARREMTDTREQHRREVLETVIKLGKSVTEVTDFKTTLWRIWDGVRNGFDFDRMGLFLYDAQNNIMQGAYGTERNGELFEAWHVKYELDPNALFYKILSRPDGVYFTKDLEKESNLSPDHDMYGVKYYAALAVWAGEKPVAIISVDQLITGRPITEEQLEALRLFAGYAGLAIQNARLNSELEQRVEERTAQLAAANKELEAFSYSISHDLRAPLRGIEGFSHILETEYGDRLDEMGKRSIKRIREGTQRMGELIEDLLEFSRMGRQALRKRKMDPTPIVREILEEWQIELGERDIEFSLTDLPYCEADPHLLRQVFLNLLGNAIKYSATRKQTRIEISSELQVGETVYFVRDNGVGFDMHYVGKLFGVFQRLHRQDEFEGTGVGLAIVQRIVQRHGGRIWAEAKLGEGATFYFTLGSG